jgi:hypothetical protein
LTIQGASRIASTRAVFGELRSSRTECVYATPLTFLISTRRTNMNMPSPDEAESDHGHHDMGSVNRMAVSATLHCLAGCAVGEMQPSACERAFELVWVQRLGRDGKRHLPVAGKAPLTCVGLTGAAGATASYLAGRFGSLHHVTRQKETRSAAAGGISFASG